MASLIISFNHFRCEVLDNDDPKVVYKALPTLVRLTKKDNPPQTRILAADTLAYLIESSPALQRVAAISNHLIPTVASFLWWDPNSTSVTLDNFNNLHIVSKPRLVLEKGEQCPHPNVGKEMKRAAFRVFSALAASDEDIRKKIIDTENLMDLLVISLHETENAKLQMAAVGCLHSLSRSVQLLRTTFQVTITINDNRYSRCNVNFISGSPGVEAINLDFRVAHFVGRLHGGRFVHFVQPFIGVFAVEGAHCG